MTDVPPSRWKVVERGRRLEVIDRLSGKAVAQHELPGNAAPGPGRLTGALQSLRPQQTRFDGGGTLTTHPFYDAKGPRTLQLDGGSAALIARVRIAAAVLGMALAVAALAWPWVLLVLVPLLQGSFRKPLRAAATRWLDRVDRENA
ncbi:MULTISPECIES: hypothetical protein [unclassified Sphingomonas]|uniref:hypothetical protein n=1 Tax=unclassified Sphingomonas TaxID=196159 RepID=UPI002269A799|nr:MULTISPECIES: hypothetical protein [unclassified Sphingomonas]